MTECDDNEGRTKKTYLNNILTNDITFFYAVNPCCQVCDHSAGRAGDLPAGLEPVHPGALHQPGGRDPLHCRGGHHRTELPAPV